MNEHPSPDRTAADLLVIGSVNEDRFAFVERFPLPGETVTAVAGRRGLGGKGANQAVAAARAGILVEFVATTGADAAGAEAVDALTAFGVRTAAVERDPRAATGTASIAVDAHGENYVIVDAGANARLGAESVARAFARGLSAPVVLTQGEIPAAAIVQAALSATSSGSRFVLNLAPVVDLPDEVLAQADPLVVNEHEAADIAARRGSDARGHIEILHALAAVSRSVVITLGAAGAIAARGGETWSVPGFRAEAVVDTTGAGDSFVGSLCARLARGADLPEAMVWASAAASLSVARPGAAESYASADEVERRLDSAGASA
ncbi:PfkB family carbohydrate kinase [Leifsonia aquatica]|uniref:PfkB family carbohydrate kinase n=1 Tax=Leifsonia aquatica TaxID=144185 RepID=UPI000468071C|nr:PfkB family carbohydrate kinase [Leifsonia aquatica]